ncbi:hypothetical protein DNH61_12570 [Paenibacillus sambharensis]|uniref:DUF4309 domain-containing protein n=1 Tax=Paenibacillus sambharensis TaxID=1803190 RepID=A0A2W1LB68_9BACL|nr:hypothetical protein [Paenibacillus sambharensis]PZD95370.1 hypothetical protein DNH61_12570 [Paenibacillus sambharensis]
MRLRGVFLLPLVVWMLAGCGSSSPGLTEEDLSISKIGDSRAKVEYGMDRTDAEKILGTGKKHSSTITHYDPGISVFYRGDKVAGITLGKQSADVYQTSKLIKAGMARSDIREIYGTENARFDSPKSLLYTYDTKEKTFLSDIPKDIDNDELINIIQISIQFDDEENAQSITLIDERMASYLY